MRFLADAMLGRLGRWLRLLGYDTVIANDILSDDEILEMAKREKRFLLTRDKNLFQRSKGVAKAHYFKSRGVKKELREIVEALRLKINFPEKTRCSICNGSLKKRKDFWICSKCSQTYWAGSHWKRIRALAKELKK
jgi:hypothetical protein